MRGIYDILPKININEFLTYSSEFDWSIIHGHEINLLLFQLHNRTLLFSFQPFNFIKIRVWKVCTLRFAHGKLWMVEIGITESCYSIRITADLFPSKTRSVISCYLLLIQSSKKNEILSWHYIDIFNKKIQLVLDVR